MRLAIKQYNMKLTVGILLCLSFFAQPAFTQVKDTIELKTIKIKGNKELPKILYLVPWQESKGKTKRNQKLKLHNFFYDLYDPISAPAPRMSIDTK